MSEALEDYDPGITDLHTRKLRYFIAVAEELHFSRAAAKVFLAQQALSRQIRELEDELGVQLFERSTRKVSLTAAGEVFLTGARAAVEAIDKAAAAALRTSREITGTLRIGYCPGAALELTELIFAEFQTRYPEVDLELREYPLVDPSAGLRDESTDVALVRLPFTTTGLETEVLFSEPLVVAVSAGHRLASKVAVQVAEILDEPITLSNTADDDYRAFWLLSQFRDGKPPPKIHPTTSVTEEAQIVAAGLAVAVTASAAARYVPHPAIRFVLLDDAPPSQVALAWREGPQIALVERLREVVGVVRDRETATIHDIEHPAGLTAATR